MSKEELEKIRTKFETKYADNISKGLYDSRDLECMRNEDTFLQTFIRNDIPAEDLLHESFKWRNEIKLRDLTEDSFDRWIWEKGAVFFHSKDKDGHRIMNIVVRHHKKDVQVLPSIKKFFAYAVEQAFLEDSTSRIVVMFDMSETGLANLDMELIKYVITCFKFYYPTFLAYMLIYEMPWIFNAAWKVIKAWLSADAVKFIKFVTKSDVQEYINREELLEHMGGLDKFEYKYPIENGNGDRPIENNHSSSLTNRKKVTFADQDSRLYKSISNDSISLDTNSNATLKKDISNHKTSPKTKKHNRDENSFIGKLLTISPAEELEFTIDDNGKESYDIISLTNTLPYSIAYKVKTTSPEKYRVRPSSGLVRSGSCTEVNVYLQTGYSSTIIKDKFLIMAMEVTDDSAENIGNLWKMVSKENIMEHRLRCIQISSDTDIVDYTDLNLTSDQRLVKISKQLDVLQNNTVILQDRIKWLIRSQFFLFVVIVIMLAVIIICFKDEFDRRYTPCSPSLF